VTFPSLPKHSNPRALVGDLRAAPDEVMRALAERGGVLGIPPPIIRPPGDAPYGAVAPEQLEQTLVRVRYAADVMGVDGVGIGTHFNQCGIALGGRGLAGCGIQRGGREQDMWRELPAGLARGAARLTAWSISIVRANGRTLCVNIP
jgi:microsomal dipeptidase-like Zn-dependent dipeptidase